MLGGAFGLTNLHFDVGRISGEATPSDKNDEFTRNSPTYRVDDTEDYFLKQNISFECFITWELSG
ncbi:hypothetical protein [Pseudoalteromonas sp. SWYJZ98]|uniref:hypothetical protein n=1 Tax=Pseudoalteromonas sp. SWYJZ98 TaxID=2792060 RepID=UPI0018CFB665|nr:hypothetical protein [Pseudoalteromonas sp. SWYJZ98]